MLGTDPSLHDDGIPFRQGIPDRGRKVFRPGHPGDAEAGAARRGLHEQGQAQLFDGPGRKGLHVFPFPVKGVRSQLHIIHAAEIALAGIFVEGHGGDERAAGGVRDTQHFEIALQEARLTGGAVLHDVHEIELDLLAQDADGEVRLVHLGLRSLGERNPHRIGFPHRDELPVAETGEDFIDIVLELVNPGSGEFPAPARHLPLGGVTSIDDGYTLVLRHKSIVCYSK